MSSTACAQKLILQNPELPTAYFDSSFYRPYEAAAHAALLLLDDARAKLEASSPETCVRAVTFRLKSPASIRDKLLKKGFSPTQEAAHTALHDIAGLRVVLTSEKAVYRYARLIRSSPAIHLIGEHDYIAMPKRSGYRSLHLLADVPVCLDGAVTSIPVEIQLRTAAMDIWASIEHQIIYKPLPGKAQTPSPRLCFGL